MKRRTFVGATVTTAAHAAPAKVKAGGIPMKEFGKTSVKVTIIAQEQWTAMMRELGGAIPVALDPAARRANIMVSGIDLARTRGKVLRLGGVRVRILGETRPCERMDEALPGLRAAMDPEWRGGAFGEVLDDGLLAVGDTAAWERSE